MIRRAYRTAASQQSHDTLVHRFAQGLAEHWDLRALHVSCDTALARGAPESRLELKPMLAWDALIGHRQVSELAKKPDSRRYHRYLPFPPSVRNKMDEWDRLRLMVTGPQNTP
ncbi:hypothetical protein Enr10x_04180 [Gimesia panareensis]|uniref:Uncharacterized protein n=1 Tax=Gimesia panareensis TaxID=2527978 RepID=A0A517Q0H9_9PLAN|nr:hypothetical protein Enr10x_04180 [Gimesia panareensis]